MDRLKTDGNTDSVKSRTRLSVERYNNSIHSVIDMTPFEALFGKKQTYQHPSDVEAQKETASGHTKGA